MDNYGLGFIDEPGRDLVRHHRTPGHPSGTFSNVRELTTAIKKFIAGWNDRARPSVWTKTADQILTKANRQPTSNTDH